MSASPDLDHSLGKMSVNEEDEAEGRNIDEALGAMIEEAEDEEHVYDQPPRDIDDQVFDALPPDLIYQASKIMGIPLVCSHCRKEGSVSSLCICPGCGGRPYHKSCWKAAAFHVPMPGFDTCKPPSDFVEYVWIHYLLFSKTSPEEQALLHRGDIWSTWFGVPNQQDSPHLYVYRRLQYLIEQGQALRYDERNFEQYPSLVSFFGDTGGGKSTLIRALIRNAALNITDQVPIPGNHVDRHKSTSGDVHLYCDPKTINTEVPLFYADCEGLRGAGVSAATRATEEDVTSTSPRQPFERHTLRKNPALSNSAFRGASKDHKSTATRTLKLQWARTTVIPSGGLADKVVIDARSRTSIVRDLYPRLLYTFSDVVCYITNNPRATEAELMHLFQWAAAGHERTVNQRVRPGLLIVVNKDVPSSDEKWLNVDYATKTLLAHLELSTSFAELREVWRLRGKILNTAEDLILCYYDSFRIICVPSLTSTTTHTIATQYQKLYNEVRAISAQVRKKKMQVNMNLTVPSFVMYLEHAFSRLTKDLTSSIDFHYLASKDAARPSKFREHLAGLLVKLKEKEEAGDSSKVVQETALVDRLTPFVACCMASQIPKNSSPEAQEKMIDSYLRDCRQALERFRDTSWRCEAKSEKARCENYWVGHEKGHQFFRGNWQWQRLVPSLLVGEFQCSFKPEEVILALYAELTRLLREGGEVETAISLVAKASGVTNVSSNRTCFTCLSQCPVFILPCEQVQHTICEDCAMRFSYSTSRSQSTLFLQRCPLGCQFKDGKPWQSRVKPPSAGVRLLSLDGGGIRGILELSILKKVVAEVGYGIPVQELFDLVIGTSTGGIVALGLFKMNWTVEKAMYEFESLSSTAFSKREWLKVPIFRHGAQLLYSHRFKSGGIDGSLQKAFGQGYLFGNSYSSTEKVKVGVVAAVPGGRRPYLFSNYSRNSTGQDTDYLVREDDPKDDLKIWEAARSTSAAPTYFEPYFHERTKQQYIDGALNRNNPVQILEEERRAIWSDKTPPDIILSIGTGIQADMGGTTKSAGKRLKTAKKLIPKGLRGKIAVGLDMVQSTLDCDRQWNEFVSSTKWDSHLSSVCHRLDIGLHGRPPNLDDVDSIPLLKHQADLYLRQESGAYLNKDYKSAHKHVRVVAKRLIAALFYFETTSLKDGKCAGVLHCRLSSAMRDQFRHLFSAGPAFRVCHRVSGKGWMIHDLEPVFDAHNFSSKIEFEERSNRRAIEIHMPRWSSWERISGITAPQ